MDEPAALLTSQLLCRFKAVESLLEGWACVKQNLQEVITISHVCQTDKTAAWCHTYTELLNPYNKFQGSRVKGRDGWKSVTSSLSGCFFSFFLNPPLVLRSLSPLSVFLYACYKSWFRQRSCCYHWGLDFRLSPPRRDVRCSLPENWF